jgi:hypothetical protein
MVGFSGAIASIETIAKQLAIMVISHTNSDFDDLQVHIKLRR